MKKNQVTIHDIAKILNIDSSTVSRALNDSSRVTKKTKDKILAIATELGYQRNRLASSLRMNKSNTIGVIVPRVSRHFFSSAIAGIEETAYEAGYKVIICQSLEHLQREQEIVETLLSYNVDGFLISISMETKNYDHLQNLKSRKVPHVFFDRHCNIPNNSNVLIDDFQAAKNATQHLIDHGCRCIAHFSGPVDLEIYRNRLGGYNSALEENQMQINEDIIIESRLMQNDGAESTSKILSLPYLVDGIFSANDVAAIGAIQHLKSKNIRIPKDMAVVGFSNEPMSMVIEPSLTTVNQSGFEMGQKSTELLLEQIESEVDEFISQTIILKSKLIARDSSDRSRT